jgi:hypothetical protein
MYLDAGIPAKPRWRKAAAELQGILMFARQ